MRLKGNVPQVVGQSRVVPKNPSGQVLDSGQERHALEGQDFAGCHDQTAAV
jgi:hypothetical protein